MNTNKQIKKIEQAFSAANIAWANRPVRAKDKPEVAELKARILAGSGEMQSDIMNGLKTFKNMTPANMQSLEQLGVDWGAVEKGLINTTNVKIARRLPQFLAFMVLHDAKYLAGSVLVAVLEFCGLAVGAKTKDALLFASTNKGNENTSDVINVARIRKVQSVLGKRDASSRPTQASVTFSKGGILDILGIVKPWGRGNSAEAMPVIVDTPLTRALCYLLETASDAKLDSWERAIEAGKKA